MTLPFPELHTARLRLRQLVATDADAMFVIYSNASAMQWYGVDPLTSQEQAQLLIELFAGWFSANVGVRWGIERCDDGRLIGSCGLFRWNKSWRNCLVGYELSRDCQTQGYMREALAVVLDYGFNEMGLHRVQAETHPDNAASIALLMRLGFCCEGLHREQGFWANRFHDLACYALLTYQWRTSKK
jgi:[ribosomal protein S5]-alanine N-acetyltransferase